jgi:hypothetical protein
MYIPFRAIHKVVNHVLTSESPRLSHTSWSDYVYVYIFSLGRPFVYSLAATVHAITCINGVHSVRWSARPFLPWMCLTGAKGGTCMDQAEGVRLPFTDLSSLTRSVFILF